MARYTIIGRQRNGTNVIGYILRDESTGTVMSYPKDVTYRLALGKQINDVITQNYNGKVTMKGTKYRISELPNYDENGNQIIDSSKMQSQEIKLYITGRVVQGKNISAYRVTAYRGYEKLRESVLPRDRVIELAKDGYIANVRHQRNNGVDILRGIDCKLSKLPVIEISLT